VDIYNEIAKGVATSEGVPLFDMNEFTKRFPPEEIFSDYSHLNSYGHRLVAEELYRQIKPVVEEICRGREN
jgi:lysophospholipase L1-like esterase